MPKSPTGFHVMDSDVVVHLCHSASLPEPIAPKRFPLCLQLKASGHAIRYFSFRVIIAQIMRALLVARATAATTRALRLSPRSGPVVGQRALAHDPSDPADGAQDQQLDTRNNRDFGDAMIRSVFDEVSGAI